MKLAIIFLAVGFVVCFSGLAIADSSENFHTLNQTLIGNNDSCPLLNEVGIAHVWNKEAKLKVKTQLSYTSDIRSLTDNNELKISNILEF